LINIDHHLTNQYFGDENLVDASVASTCEIVLALLEYMEVPIDVEIATSLLTGIVTDTRGFRTNNVTEDVLHAALRLMERGASLPQIAYYGLDRRPTAAILLWGAALAQLRIDDGIIWTSIPLAMRRATGHTGNGDAGLVSFLIGAADANVAAVFTELADGQVDVSLRATAGFDVSQVALQCGGGGHALASGCTVHGSLEEAQERVLSALRTDVARQRQSDG
jgi:phosphoesterase RecJ-like protein